MKHGWFWLERSGFMSHLLKTFYNYNLSGVKNLLFDLHTKWKWMETNTLSFSWLILIADLLQGKLLDNRMLRCIVFETGFLSCAYMELNLCHCLIWANLCSLYPVIFTSAVWSQISSVKDAALCLAWFMHPLLRTWTTRDLHSVWT